jgi:hypothetical protein
MTQDHADGGLVSAEDMVMEIRQSGYVLHDLTIALAVPLNGLRRNPEDFQEFGQYLLGFQRQWVEEFVRSNAVEAANGLEAVIETSFLTFEPLIRSHLSSK